MNILKHSFKFESSFPLLESCEIQPKIRAMSEIGNIIRARLKELGKTQGWLAEAAGVSNNAVSLWIRRGSIALDNATVVAGVLGITVDQLLGGDQASGSQQDWRTDLVKLSPVERRILTLFRGADDRGKLEMLSSLEEYARNVETERRIEEAKARQAEKASIDKPH